ncbi:hypothetical protein [Streptomyces sp. NPDC001054]
MRRTTIVDLTDLSTLPGRVAAAHGAYCHCQGACGNPHTAGKGTCYADREFDGARLVAAPWPYPAETDQAAATTPETDMRLWCPACWRLARKRTAETRAERLRSELAESQLGLDLDL